MKSRQCNNYQKDRGKQANPTQTHTDSTIKYLKNTAHNFK